MMFSAKEKRPYGLRRDFRVLEREKRVTKILGSHAFRAELEGILQGQLDGSRSPPKLSTALTNLQDNVLPAAAVEAAHRQATTAMSGGSSSVILPINDLRGVRASRYLLAERQLRCKLASLCRLVDWFGWSQLVHNHVSAEGMSEREEFLINPFGLLYSEVTASSLLRVNNKGVILDGGSTQLGVNRAGVELHSAIYRARRDVKCIMHLHTVAGAAVSAMSCGLLPISQEALSVGKVSYYHGRGSVTGQQERKEFTRALGKNKVLILHNHGLIAVGCCVEECFHFMYNLVQACQIQVAAISAGLANLRQVSAEVGEEESVVGGAGVWNKRGQMAFEALMRMLDNQGYQTGYKYCGLSLLQAAAEADSKPVWDDVVEGGETDMTNRQRRRRALKAAAKKKDNKDVWSFLEDNRSRDKPLTKNTKIRVRGVLGDRVSPVPEDNAESRDCWEFLASKDSSVHATGSKPETRPSTAQRDSSQQQTNTSDASITTEDLVNNNTSQSHHTAGGRKRTRRRRQTRSNPSPAHTTSQAAGSSKTSNSQALSVSSHNPATLSSLPPDMTALRETAERVAHSTSAAVQKLSLRREREEETLGSSYPKPNYMLRHDEIPSTQPPLSSTHLQVDSQGYTSGDEASNVGSPRRPVQATTNTATRESTLGTAHNLHTTAVDTPHVQPYKPISPEDSETVQSSQLDHSHHAPPPASHHTAPFTHSPADISYPNGYSSAEKAVYVARLVADSTGTAVQKLSETLTERRQLSLSSGEHSTAILSPTNLGDI